MRAHERRRRLVGRVTLAALASVLVSAVAATPIGATPALRKPPQGPPIELFMVNLQGGTGTTTPQVSAAARAAVKGVNAAGGVRDRPLRLIVCAVDQTPDSGRSCLTRAAAAKPVAVYTAQPGGATESLAVLQGAGIPYVAETCNTSAELTGQFLTFCFSSNFVNFYSGSASYLKSLKTVHKVTLAYVNEPAILGGVKSVGEPMFVRAGITPTDVPLPNGTADIEPAVTTALGTHPDAHVTFTAGPGCVSTMHVRAQTKSEVPFLYPSLCTDHDVLVDGGRGARDARFVGPTAAVDPHELDVSIYRKQMHRYAPTTDPADVLAQAGFAGIVNLTSVLKQVPSETDITALTVTAAFKAARALPLFLAGSGTFTCDGTVLPQFKALCSLQARVVEYTAKGKLRLIGTY